MKYMIDLHTHSISAGHGYSTFQENVIAAYEKGLQVYGFSEHGPKMEGGPHEFFFGNMLVLPSEYKGMRILKGIEANIMDLDGTLDLDEKRMKKLDYVIASFHIVCVKSGTPKENTDCLLKVMDNPLVKIIGHPDDSRYPLEYERLVPAAKEKGVLLEVNNSSLHPNAVRVGAVDNVTKYLKLCKELEVPIILGTDSHYAPCIGNFSAIEAILEELDFPEELIINNSIEKLRKYIPII